MADGAIDFPLSEAPALGDALLERLSRLRRSDPIFWSEANQSWIVTGHAEVDDGLKNRLPLSAVRMPEIFARRMPEEERASRIPYLMQTVRLWVMNNDPPDHTRLRRLIMPAFSKRIAEGQRPFARQLAREVLDRLGPGVCEVEFVGEVAREIPQRMILRLFGLPDSYRDHMSRWVATTTQTFGNAMVAPKTLELCEAVMLEMRGYLLEEIAQRRAHPADDFISALLAAQEQGDRLSDEEMLGICFVTLLGGFNTTANTIALGAAALARHPQACERLRDRSVEVEPLLMELMRYIAMSTTVPRIALEDFDWEGHAIKQGQYVFLMIAGANRDDGRFPQPDRLDFDRSQEGNLVFAPGLHFCIGHHFAKMQLSEVFAELLERYDLTLLDDHLDFGPALAFRGVEQLHMRLTPRAGGGGDVSVSDGDASATEAAPSLEDLCAWASTILGRAVGAPQRIPSGSSRAMYVLPVEGGGGSVLRVDLGVGPMAGTALTLDREAEVYRALADAPVPTPRFQGLHPSGRAFLMERVAGIHDLATLAPSERAAVCDRFMETLADLHRLPADRLNIPSLATPRGPHDHGRIEVEFWRQVMDDQLSGDLALGRLAADVLNRLAPAYEGPTVLCHGDAGPKNFMFEDGRITAIIDLEMSHLGDPMDDLAWWIFRGHEWLGAGGDLDHQLAVWSARSGLPVDPNRLGYYWALVLFRCYVEGRTGLRSSGRVQDRLPYLRFQWGVDVKLAFALAWLLRADLGPLPQLEPQPIALAREASEAMRLDLVEHLIPALNDPEAQRRAQTAQHYLDHLEAVDRYGQAIREQDAAELNELAGRPVPFADEASVLAQVLAEPPERQLDLLRYAMRRGVRHAHLWPQVLERAIARPWTPDALRRSASAQRAP